MLMNNLLAIAGAAVAGISLISTPATAATIIYEGTLSNEIPSFGSVSSSGDFNSPTSGLSDYWNFFGNQGDTAIISVNRLETAFDPALWVFEGSFNDDSAFDGAIGFDDVGFLGFADDEIPNPGPFGDPELVLTLTLPGTGEYTAIVTNFSSGNDGGDGLFDYQITATGIVDVDVDVPEPSSILGAILVGVVMAGHSLKKTRAA